MKNKLFYTLDKYNLEMDINDSFEVNILSKYDGIIISLDISPKYDDISPYSFEDRESEIGEYLINLIEEYIINKRNNLINDILK